MVKVKALLACGVVAGSLWAGGGIAHAGVPCPSYAIWGQNFFVGDTVYHCTKDGGILGWAPSRANHE
jgi:hypothetical protein